MSMMRIITNNTPTTELENIKVNDAISDGISKFGNVESIEVDARVQFRLYIYTLITGEKIVIQKW